MTTRFSDNELQLNLINKFIKPINLDLISDEVGKLRWWRDIERKMLLELSSFMLKNSNNKEQGIKVIETVISKLARDMLSHSDLSPFTHERVSWFSSNKSTEEIIENLEMIMDDIETVKKLTDETIRLSRKNKKPWSGWLCCSSDMDKPISRSRNEPDNVSMTTNHN